MEPRIELLQRKKLVGHSLRMTLANDRTFELWNGFMPKRKRITNAVGTNLYSVQVYSNLVDIKNFGPNVEFEKWAAVEVAEFTDYAENFETLELESGLYAVFIHKGGPREFQKTVKAIYTDWLPNSGYVLDHRPHFELLGAKYRNNHPDSEEEVWVPVRKRFSK